MSRYRLNVIHMRPEMITMEPKVKLKLIHDEDSS